MLLYIKLVAGDKDTNAVIKCKPPTTKAGKSAAFEKTLYQLKVDEPPEKFVLWIKDVYDKNITNTAKPDWEMVFTLLVNLTDKAANAIIHTVSTNLATWKWNGQTANLFVTNPPSASS